MRRNSLLLLVFCWGMFQINCGQPEIRTVAEKKDAAPWRDGRGGGNTLVVTDIIFPVGSLTGYCGGRWTVMSAYVAVHERPSDRLNRVVLKMEMDRGRRHNGLHGAVLLSTSELDSFIHAIAQMSQKAAAMKTQEVENTHIRLDVKKGMYIGFEQKGYEQDAYLSLNPATPDALLHFDMTDLRRLQTIAHKGSERLRAMGVP